ncbi:MAG: glycoside hydrolase family 27 protein [Acidobacteriaceae bacterium]|nr:glycoside hydrolase family 27 protein [Acidobacteriaceae bacterium]
MGIWVRLCVGSTIGLLAGLLALAAPGKSQDLGQTSTVLASLPPMGWNSWDSYGLSVTEDEFRANASWLAQHLAKHGWQYVVVDEGWYLQNPEAKPGSFRFTMSADGRYLPAVNRFPSANDAGFKPLADWAHGLGLKFGIHIIRGIPREAVDRNLPIAGSTYHAADAADKADTCPWNADNYGVTDTPAGQAYYDSLAKLYASWGLDFVKIDCIASRPYKGPEIRMFSQALRKTGRPIVLSLSPGPAPLDKLQELRKYAQMWRISDDFWDRWKASKQSFPQGLLPQFNLTANWAPYVGSGHWPDADMLPLGYIGPRPGWGKARETELTQDEQRTVMTLWSVFRSPLIMGGNLTRMDEWTTSLLTNDEVLTVDQHSKANRVVANDAKKAVWTAQPATQSGLYVALFNLDDQPQTLQFDWADLSLSGKVHRVRDLWQHRDLGSSKKLRVILRPHASVLYGVAETK